MAKFVCNACGYIYDEELGCPEEGIIGGTNFTDLPKDLACPGCDASLDEFEEAED